MPQAGHSGEFNNDLVLPELHRNSAATVEGLIPNMHSDHSVTTWKISSP